MSGWRPGKAREGQRLRPPAGVGQRETPLAARGGASVAETTPLSS